MMVSFTSMILIAGDAGKGGSFLDSLPDPMRPTFFEVGFIVVLLVLLHFFLKYAFFRPLGKLIDDREAEIQAGADVKVRVSNVIQARQAEYAEKLKGFRARAFERRKALAQAATDEKAGVIDKARQNAVSLRKDAMDKLDAQRETAKTELIAQVDALADSMAQHLLKQA